MKWYLDFGHGGKDPGALGTNKTKESKIINKVIFLVTVIVYFLVSFIWNSWAVSWIIFIIGILVAQVIKLIIVLGGNQNEEK